MRPIFVLAILLASPAFAQNHPTRTNQDIYDLQAYPDGSGVLHYYNHELRQSTGGTRVMESDGLQVTVHVEVQNGPEIITVTPPVGYEAIPPRATVPDGEGIDVQIVPLGQPEMM